MHYPVTRFAVLTSNATGSALMRTDMLEELLDTGSVVVLYRAHVKF